MSEDEAWDPLLPQPTIEEYKEEVDWFGTTWWYRKSRPRSTKVNQPCLSNTVYVRGDLFSYLGSADRCSLVCVHSIFKKLAYFRVVSVNLERLLYWNTTFWHTWLQVTRWYKVRSLAEAINTPLITESALWLREALAGHYGAPRKRESEGQRQGQSEVAGSASGSSSHAWSRYVPGQATECYQREPRPPDESSQWWTTGQWWGSSWWDAKDWKSGWWYSS